MEDKASRSKFFQETFLVADTKFKAVSGMPFLKISNTDVSFGKRTLTQKSYITIKVLPTTTPVQIVNLKEFVIVVLDEDSKTFVIHVAIQEQKKIVMDSVKKTQIEAQNRAKVGALIFNKTPTEILEKYFDYSNVFSAKNVVELLKNSRINEYAIKLKKGKQSPFGQIYSLGPVKLELLKNYIETNMANSFICSSLSPARALIFFNQKPDKSLGLCIDY